MTDTEIREALDDWQALTITIYGEAAIEPIEGKVAVGCVIRNRVNTPRRFGGSTYRGVVHARAQFSCWWSYGGEANFQRTMAIALSYAEGTPIPVNAGNGSAFAECGWVASGIISGKLRDRVKGATHYYAPAAMVPRDRIPDWAKGKTPVARIGGHLFFANVP